MLGKLITKVFEEDIHVEPSKGAGHEGFSLSVALLFSWAAIISIFLGALGFAGAILSLPFIILL